MNVIDKLTTFGYDGADIHRIMTFFNIRPIIKDPFFPEKTEGGLNINSEGFDHIEALVTAKNLQALDNCIYYSKMGLTVTTAFLANNIKTE